MTGTDLPPAAFLSYVHADDENDNGAITTLRERLQGEIGVQIGRKFVIFQDRTHVQWGEAWRRRLEEGVDTVALLIPVITPMFFASGECRREVERFLDRERELGRNDLILPIYYVSASEIDDPARREGDPIAGELASRQYEDWRHLRFEPFTSPVVRRQLAQLAARLRENFWQDVASATIAPPAAAERAPERASAAARPARTVAVRNDPPTLVVDQFGRADHDTITAAVDAARPGTRILVRPGLYEEGLVIDKALEILGDGPVGDIIVRAKGQDAVLFEANIGRIANLSLRQAGEGAWYAVDVTQGRLELEDCDIVSASLACVGVHHGADPRVRRCRIHDGGGEGGIFVYERGLGTFEDNEIVGSRTSGVEIKDGGDPTFRRNRIVDGRQTGIYVYEQGLGTFEDNEIVGNGYSGIALKEGASPTFRRNRIANGHQTGVYVHDEGLGRFEDNEIVGNALSGIYVTTGGNPIVRRNKVASNGGYGIWLAEDAKGTFEGNELADNAKGPWSPDLPADVDVSDSTES